MEDDTSWEGVADWYDHITGKKGHTYHNEVIFPHLKHHLQHLKKESFLVDIGCGNGSLISQIPKNISYLGIDASKSLIAKAPKREKAHFLHHDVNHPLEKGEPADAIVFVLSLQNMGDPKKILTNIARLFYQNTQLFLVLNHPVFRIPRQTSWGIDEKTNLQYRRCHRYLTPMKIPIDMHPSQQQSSHTFSFHYPLSYIMEALREHGFVVSHLDEWVSTKKSTGKHAARENLARKEFPLFLFIKAHYCGQSSGFQL